MLLGLMGNDVRTAHDGREAMTVVEAFRPNGVVLDIGLPRMNGYDVAREIRRQPWGRQVTLIALTGWGQEQDQQQARDAGFDHHMVKPVDTSALMNVLLDRQAARTPSVTS